MTEKARTALLSEADSNLPDNDVNAITAADVRNIVKDLADSSFNLLSDDSSAVANGSHVSGSSVSDALDTLKDSLGTMASQDANDVAITGGSISGITDLAVADGGTGASTAADARTNLDLYSKEETDSAISTAIAAIGAPVVLKGTWDASAGTFPGGAGTKTGWSYIVSAAGTVNGVDFSVNDRLIQIVDNASTTVYAGNWLKADYSDLVTSVAGRTGNVTLSRSDVSGAGDVLSTNNLSDLASIATARTNLGLGTAATTNASAYATAAQGTKADDAVGSAQITVVTSSETFNFNAKTKFAIVEVLGGGGGGGSGSATSTASTAGGGGGNGGYSRKLVSGVSSATISIGSGGASASAGGNTSYSDGTNSITCNGGSAGANGASSTAAQGAAGGAGGTATGGDVNIQGQRGGLSLSLGSNAFSITWYAAFGGRGGSSPYGAGGDGNLQAGAIAASVTGAAATGFGSGGQGGMCTNGGSSASGGAGTAGVVIITEFM